MKSGTNQYHGSAFEINRNSFFDSVPFFDGPAWGGSTKPPTDHENNYGFSIAGPIRIPHLYDGRNKTFGNYSQEWFKQAQANDRYFHGSDGPGKDGQLHGLCGWQHGQPDSDLRSDDRAAVPMQWPAQCNLPGPDQPCFRS